MLTVLCCVALVVSAVFAAIRMEAAWLTPPTPPARGSRTPTASASAARQVEAVFLPGSGTV